MLKTLPGASTRLWRSAVAGNVGCVAAIRQATPQIEAAPGHEPRLNAERCELRAGFATHFRQAWPERIQVLAVAAIAQGAEDQLSRDGTWTAEARRDLKIDKRLDPIRAGGDVAAADRAGQGFGEAADPDHAGEPVEGREARRRLGLEVGEDIVLDDGEVVGRRCIQDPVSCLRARSSRRSDCEARSW